MSANANLTNPEKKKRVLMIAANPSTSPTTGWPVGFWWAELTHPYWTFAEAGYEIEIRSPSGGALRADGYSDPEDPSGYSRSDILSLGFKHSPDHMALLTDTKSIEDVNVDSYDVLYIAGGQSPMVTFPGHESLQQLVAAFYEAGKITTLVCHATCLLLETRLSSGDLLVQGKSWTGFADAEEKLADQFVGQKMQPFWIEESARKIEQSNFVVDQPFRPFALRDGLLITGQQQYSGAAAAEEVLAALGR